MVLEEHRITLRDGAELYVKLLGAENKDKPLIIATHGGPGVVDHTEGVNSFGFLSQCFQVIAYDMRGSGKSTDKGPYTHAQFAADLDDLRDWAKEEQIIVAGASYGGIVAMEYTLRYPQRVCCLLMRNTTAYGLRLILNMSKALMTTSRVQPDPDRVIRLLTGAHRDVDDMLEFFADAGVVYKPEYTASGEKRPVAQRVKMPPEQLHPECASFVCVSNMPRYDIRPQLASISVPTMIVGGRQDVATTDVDVQEIASLIPDAELTILEGAGHNLADDEPGLWKETVWNFLDTRGLCKRPE